MSPSPSSTFTSRSHRPATSRRGFLKFSAAAAATCPLATTLHSHAASPAAAIPALATSRFPGHQPGLVYVGMSADGDWSSAVRLTGPVGLRRSFGGWSNDAGQLRTIAEDHAAGRLPWVSFKAPVNGASGWRQLAAGAWDAELRARARRYAALKAPVVLTFHHEPGDSGTQAEGKDWAAAWCRVYDVFEAEGALNRVAMAPILSDWLFQPRNRAEDPADWVTRGVLRRIDAGGFLGVDVYQNKTNDGFAERLGQVLAWCDAQGYPDTLVGVGEHASCRYFGDSPKPENWIRDNWAWAEANRANVAAVSYFHSTANSKTGHRWRLDEAGTTKLAKFKAMTSSRSAAQLSRVGA